jgi:hypothetical protein
MLYITSTELRVPYKPRLITITQRLTSEVRDDFALVDLCEPIESWVYDTPEDLSQLILASRLTGDSVFKITHTPMAVYICYLRAPVVSTSINSHDLVILDWGELTSNDNGEVA